MKRTQLVIGLVILAATLAPLPALAGDEAALAGNPGARLARGVVNAGTGWLEVPKQTAIGGQEAGVAGLIGGLFRGVAMGVARTAVGGLEAATFWAPVPDEPIIKPVTVFGRREAR